MPRPPAASARDRLAGCLRALANAPELPVSFDGGAPSIGVDGAHLPALVQPPNPAEWVAWRALVDAMALGHRHRLPLRRAPRDPRVGLLFSVLAQTRAEILGARHYPGVAVNLAAALAARYSPARGPDLALPERLHLLLHARAGAVRLPADLQPALARWRNELEIGELAERLSEDRGYAAGSLRLARRLRGQTAAPPPASVPARPLPGQAPCAPAGGRRGTGRGRRAAAATVLGPRRDSHTGSAVATESEAYCVFTTAYDRTLRPRDLASAVELAALRRQLDAQQRDARRQVARLANRLERRLLVQSPRRWRGLQRDGLLDPQRLALLITRPGDPPLFRRRQPAPERDVAVTLLLDNSASMRGARLAMVALCAELLGRSLHRVGISLEVLGFTTLSWDGGRARRDWVAAGQPPSPGRLNERCHIIYKGADQPWRQARNGLGLMLRDELPKENLDGEAVLWAARRLSCRPERRRLLVIVGDGEPQDRATSAASGERYLRGHLEAVVAGLEAAQRIELLAIGVGGPVDTVYRRAVMVTDAARMAEVLCEDLARQITTSFPPP